MFHVIGFIFFGLIVGLIARAILPGRQQMSIPATTLIGIAGALIAGFLGRMMGFYGPEDGVGFVLSITGAIVALVIYSQIGKRQTLHSLETKNSSKKAA